ncbi:N-acetylglucosamine-6-phosphate deacetylase-like [Oscarella lobularis]|uniref:N-acetylglucosamine-6-phosphate deacetylase-like n=1 Tax=Oscarella lobularis TaxID=121494 RepID=UPI0033143BD8
MICRFTNCKLLRDGHLLGEEDLWVRNGIILNPRDVFWGEKRTPDRVIDCKGYIAAPGFIDTQINGALGFDFSSNLDNFPESLCAVAKEILRHGVTAFCPTIVSSTRETYKEILPKFVAYESGPDEATLLGLHLEGPFISQEKRGAHHEKAVWVDEDKAITMDTLMKRYGSLERVSIVTVAPELRGMYEVIEELQQKNIAVSLGHSMCNLDGAEDAVNRGSRFITHLFNAMLPFHHRDPGIVGLLTSKRLKNRQIYYGIIGDGVHTDPAALRIAYRANPKGVVLVTDAMAAMGLSDGIHSLGCQSIEVQGNQARLVGEKDRLAGSVATMDHCVRYFEKETGCGIPAALEAASLHPAKMLRLENERGTLNYGSRADFILLDNDMNVQRTYIDGRLVYETKK